MCGLNTFLSSQNLNFQVCNETEGTLLISGATVRVCGETLVIQARSRGISLHKKKFYYTPNVLAAWIVSFEPRMVII